MLLFNSPKGPKPIRGLDALSVTSLGTRREFYSIKIISCNCCSSRRLCYVLRDIHFMIFQFLLLHVLTNWAFVLGLNRPFNRQGKISVRQELCFVFELGMISDMIYLHIIISLTSLQFATHNSFMSGLCYLKRQLLVLHICTSLKCIVI